MATGKQTIHVGRQVMCCDFSCVCSCEYFAPEVATCADSQMIITLTLMFLCLPPTPLLPPSLLPSFPSTLSLPPSHPPLHMWLLPTCRPTSLDAVVFAHLCIVLQQPLPGNNALWNHLLSLENLVRYCGLIRRDHFPELSEGVSHKEIVCYSIRERTQLWVVWVLHSSRDANVALCHSQQCKSATGGPLVLYMQISIYSGTCPFRLTGFCIWGMAIIVYIRRTVQFYAILPRLLWQCMCLIVHDVLVALWWNSTIMRHLSYKSTSFEKTSIPIHGEMSARGLKEVTLSFSRDSFDVLWCFVRKSWECHVTSMPKRRGGRQ